MWKSLRSYFAFLSYAAKEDCNRSASGRLVISVIQRLNKAADLLLGAGLLAGALYLVYQYVPVVINKRWTAIVVLSGCVLFLLWLIGAVKRFHELALNRVFEEQAGITSEYQTSSDKIELLKLLLGRSDALYFLLDNRRWSDNSGPPISKSEIQYHEGDIRNTLQDRFGPDDAENYFNTLGDIPDSLQAQTDRMRAHQSRLHGLIQAERGHKRAIADKAIWQRQEVLTAYSRKKIQ